MRAVLALATIAALFALGGSHQALAEGECSMNSNKPCSDQAKKLSSKEPAYKSLNSNTPTSQKSSDSPARVDVQAKGTEETATKATLSGVSASDLKVKPKPAPTSEKEPAN